MLRTDCNAAAAREAFVTNNDNKKRSCDTGSIKQIQVKNLTGKVKKYEVNRETTVKEIVDKLIKEYLQEADAPDTPEQSLTVCLISEGDHQVNVNSARYQPQTNKLLSINPDGGTYYSMLQFFLIDNHAA